MYIICYISSLAASCAIVLYSESQDYDTHRHRVILEFSKRRKIDAYVCDVRQRCNSASVLEMHYVNFELRTRARLMH